MKSQSVKPCIGGWGTSLWCVSKGTEWCRTERLCPSAQSQLSKVEAVVLCCWGTGCRCGRKMPLEGCDWTGLFVIANRGFVVKKKKTNLTTLSFFACLLELLKWKEEFPLKRKGKIILWVFFCCSFEEIMLSSDNTRLFYLFSNLTVEIIDPSPVELVL